jgi:hypothetical protein
MAQQSSIRPFGIAPVDGRRDNLVRLAVKELTLVLHVRWRCFVADCLLARGHRMDAFGAVGCGSWHP